ncbi:hypothetical protein VMCG_10777 [Cytospora schulzeri]|uniref:Rhodopsin domain-containing protein n=1 Tax=Cytospora schulzeri TaxID=448051 RepID=A0A423V9J9_9PEZI|nr:hypothetical protein VMCG_10777 [Valsa malicola]
MSLGFFLFNIFQCTPIEYLWLQWDGEHEGHCIDTNKVTLSGGIIDLFLALIVLIIPLPYILRLKLPPHKKFATTVMFAWGICTIAIMGYRFTTLQVYDGGYNSNMNLSRNLSIDGIGVMLWSGLELDVALICACMPSVYPLFLRIIHYGRPPPSRPVPNRSVVTIGGSGGKLQGRFKKHGLWSSPSMTGLEETNLREDTGTQWPSGEYVELGERMAH